MVAVNAREICNVASRPKKKTCNFGFNRHEGRAKPSDEYIRYGSPLGMRGDELIAEDATKDI